MRQDRQFSKSRQAGEFKDRARMPANAYAPGRLGQVLTGLSRPPRHRLNGASAAGKRAPGGSFRGP